MTDKQSWLACAAPMGLLFWATMTLAACGGTETINHLPDAGDAQDAQFSGDATSGPVDGGADRQGPDGDGGTIQIYVAGDVTARTFTDGLAGQTPRDYVMGLSRFDLMRAANDPSPVTVFDKGADHAEMDMLGRTLAGVGYTAELPAGSYSHGRVLLTMTRFTVDATAHYNGLSLPGALTITGALSDTTIDGHAFTKGQAQYHFTSGVISPTLPGSLPPLPSTAGGAVVTEGTNTWLVFAFPTPLVVDPSDPAAHVATITYDVFESFRWQDQATAGYATGTFDVDANALTFEPVMNFGATGYRVDTE